LLGEAGFFSRFFFSWSFPFSKEAKKGQLYIEQFGDLRDTDKIEKEYQHTLENWEYFRKTKSDYKLMKCIFYSFRW
jgi:hypothetical protein